VPLRDPAYLWDADMPHFGASFGAVLTNAFPADLSMAGMADFGSWGDALMSDRRPHLDARSAGDLQA
jgi:hypothetical protein